MQHIPNLKAIHHVALICSDYARSKEFYTNILCLEPIAETYRNERDSWKLDLAVPGGGSLELFSFPDAPPRPTYPEACGLRHLAFAVDDLDTTIAFLKLQNVLAEPVRTDESTGCRFTFIKDPDGLPIELYENTEES